MDAFISIALVFGTLGYIYFVDYRRSARRK